jgi:hypothetical protein
MFKRRGKNRRTGDQLKFLKLLPRGLKDNADDIGLSNFDSCIEASDSLAASPTSAEFEDCSIFISPDGILMEEGRRSEGGHSHENAKDKNEDKNEEETDDIADKVQPSISSDEYESSICVGNDMTVDGEKEVNGFSARGWTPFMATMAMNRAVDTMQ